MADTLAQMVRKKYPGVYDDMSDTELEAKVDEKHPGAYSDLLRTKVAAEKPANAPKTHTVIMHGGTVVQVPDDQPRSGIEKAVEDVAVPMMALGSVGSLPGIVGGVTRAALSPPGFGLTRAAMDLYHGRGIMDATLHGLEAAAFAKVLGGGGKATEAAAPEIEAAVAAPGVAAEAIPGAISHAPIPFRGAPHVPTFSPEALGLESAEPAIAAASRGVRTPLPADSILSPAAVAERKAAQAASEAPAAAHAAGPTAEGLIAHVQQLRQNGLSKASVITSMREVYGYTHHQAAKIVTQVYEAFAPKASILPEVARAMATNLGGKLPPKAPLQTENLGDLLTQSLEATAK